MSIDQYMIFTLIFIMLLFFIWGRWRYDLVALVTLLIATFLGLVPFEEAFSGFGHPAVITVAAVLVVSKGLMNAGIVDFIAKNIMKMGEHTMVQLTLLVLAVTVSSAFMNNIGALALMMPVAIKMARRSNKSPSLFLMPLAFGSLLGGMMTLVGTPPNIIISTFRAGTVIGEPFQMFDFAPVGAAVAFSGIVFILLIGWRLIPERKAGVSREDLFEINDYISELIIPEGSSLAGKTVGELESSIKGELKVLGLVKNDKNYPAPSAFRILSEGNSVIVEAATDEIQELLDATDLVLADSDKLSEKDISSEDVSIVEAVIMNNSFIIGKTAKFLQLRTRYGINLLGVAREGVRINEIPDNVRFQIGDILLLQGDANTMTESLTSLGCLPLAARGISLGKPRRLLLSVAIFATSLALSATGVLPVQVAFASAAAVMVLTRFITLKEVYDSIDWPIIILLGAIIPVSQVLETSGGAQLIAGKILLVADRVPPWGTVAMILITAMMLSDVVNNAAAVLIMAPIAIEIAIGLAVSPDPLLMSVAIGASCSFLTPIGHQSNTLVMGPGGYKFCDYWKLGLPLEIIVVAVAVPLILIVWPL